MRSILLAVSNVLDGGLIMRKGYFYFPNSSRLSKFVICFAILSFFISMVLFLITNVDGLLFITIFLRDGFRAFNFYTQIQWGHIWSIFFLILGIFAIMINVTIHKICEDIAYLLKQGEVKKS